MTAPKSATRPNNIKAAAVVTAVLGTTDGASANGTNSVPAQPFLQTLLKVNWYYSTLSALWDEPRKRPMPTFLKKAAQGLSVTRPPGEKIPTDARIRPSMVR